MKKIIFLDIDGVIYALHKHKENTGSVSTLKQAFAAHHQENVKTNNSNLEGISVGWDMRALAYILKLVEETEASIVISSSWKFARSLDTLKQIFKPFALDSYIMDRTSDAYGFLKVPAIHGYLKDHGDITRYVIIDDLSMEKEFPHHMVVCLNMFDEECYQKALAILKN